MECPSGEGAKFNKKRPPARGRRANFESLPYQKNL
jgi:hypothetical protein